MISATFHPQAWQSDYAIDVDPEGETSWTVSPAFLAELQAKLKNPARLLEDSTDESDYLREDPAAPAWVRDWHGPFWVEVEEREVVLFSVYAEGAFVEVSDLEDWYAEQANFDDPRDAERILYWLGENGQTTWAGGDYRLVDAAAFARARARLGLTR